MCRVLTSAGRLLPGDSNFFLTCSCALIFCAHHHAHCKCTLSRTRMQTCIQTNLAFTNRGVQLTSKRSLYMQKEPALRYPLTHIFTQQQHCAEFAACCSVLQCVAVCCSVLQCVAVFEVTDVQRGPNSPSCSVMQCVAVFEVTDVQRGPNSPKQNKLTCVFAQQQPCEE